MANHLKTIVKKKNGIIKFKIVVEKLQKSLLLGKKLGSDKVKEGHFAVIAVEEDEHKRFVIPLTYLNHPSFSRLLDQAAEEYGFDHKGALTIPCQPCELERMLEDREIGSPVKPS